MPLTYHRTFRIRSHECDVHGRLSNAVYLNYVTECSMDSPGSAFIAWD